MQINLLFTLVKSTHNISVRQAVRIVCGALSARQVFLDVFVVIRTALSTHTVICPDRSRLFALQ